MNGDLADLKRVDKADVYQNRILAGRLERRGDGYIQFTYTDEYLLVWDPTILRTGTIVGECEYSPWEPPPALPGAT